MKTLMLAAALAASPAQSAELWTYLNDADCSAPAIFISEESDSIERLDFQCKILTAKGLGLSTYTAECQTDLPSVETMQIVVDRKSDGTALIEWSGVDADTYRLCPPEPDAATM